MTNGNDLVHSLQATEYSQAEYGLTKREYFAAMAMQGLCVNLNSTIERTAVLSVMLADLLISELNKPGNETTN